MARENYLGPRPPTGNTLRQVVTCGGAWVTVLTWNAAARCLKPREQWIGWDAAKRSGRLKLVVQNRRFLVLSAQRQPNLLHRRSSGVRTFVGWQQEAYNHNRRDVSLNEDRIRSKNVNICVSPCITGSNGSFRMPKPSVIYRQRWRNLLKSTGYRKEGFVLKCIETEKSRSRKELSNNNGVMVKNLCAASGCMRRKPAESPASHPRQR